MALRISAEVTLQGTDAYGFALKQIGLTRRDLRVQSRAPLGAGVRNAGPSLRSGCPVLLSAGVAPNNSLRSLRSLHSNTFGESVHEAREYARRPHHLRCSAAHTHPGAQPGTALQPPAVARYEVETPSHRPDAAQSDREARRVAGVGGYVTWPIRVDSLVQALLRREVRP